MDSGLTGYKWVVLEEKNKAPEDILKKFGKVIGQLLYNRKEIFDNNFEEDNIYPTLKKLLDPQLFNDLDRISYELASVIKSKKRIVIYGDYDADGITSTSLLVNFFKEIKADVRYYIPSRFYEGYGLNRSAIKKIAQMSDVLIVVDSGTNAYEELLYAKKLGLKVFVLDHHEAKEEILEEEHIYILNPKLHDKINPLFKHLASVGITFYVIIMLRRLLDLDIKLKPYLDIVALGTVADVVPLSLINRILVQKGIEEINKKRRVGLKALLDYLSIDKVTSFDVGFVLAPRLNAAGRLDDAKKAVKLLTTKDESKGRQLSIELEVLNKKRQKLTELAFKESQVKLKKEKNIKSIVVADENWHPGIVGIVAGRLAHQYKVPAVVLSVKNGTAIGSVRSTGNINIYKIMEENADLFDRFGGHTLAAGLTMPSKNIEKFKEILIDYVSSLKEEDKVSFIEVDMEVPLSYWTPENVEKLKILEPFGEGNPYPKFIARGLRIDDFMTVGAGNQHLKFWFKDIDGKAYPALWWGSVGFFKKLSVGMNVDIIYTPKLSTWNGDTGVEFIVEDIKIN
ncbi:single-stranded-DNA-specific exonuclease RecJ [Persephonella sp.]